MFDMYCEYASHLLVQSQAMLNRLIQAKKDAAAAPIQRRPFLASEVDNINDAER